MNASFLLSAHDIMLLAQPSLAKMDPAEAATAVKCLDETVIKASNPDAQQILFSTWLSINDRIAWEMTQGGAK